MADLWVLVLGVGLMPFLAIGLYSYTRRIESRRDVSWGLLAGVLAFLGLGHAMAAVLFDHPFIVFGVGAVAAFLVVAIGIAAGLGAGWWLLERAPSQNRRMDSLIAWTAVAFLGLHSFTDGLVLGQSFAGPVLFGFDVTALAFVMTVFHRFAEGGLVIVPAIAARWSVGRSLAILAAGLLIVPAAFLPGLVYNAFSAGTASTATHVLEVLAAGAEAGLALFLLFLGFIPVASQARGTRWALWAGVGFLAIVLVHSLVE